MTDVPADRPEAEDRQRIALVVGLALLAAGLVLVMFVLPAEFAVDPLGTGARLGLLPLGVTGRTVAALNAEAAAGRGGQGAIIVGRERPFQTETMDLALARGEAVEYKYRLDKGAALLYSWSATAPLDYELHAEPDGAPAGYAQSYEKRTSVSQAAGTLTAPFSGIHGWYWQNPGHQAITLTLKTSGFYTISHEFRSGVPVKNKTFR